MNRRTIATLAAGVLLGWSGTAIAEGSATPPTLQVKEIRTPADRVPSATEPASPGWLAARTDLRQLQEIQEEGRRRIAELTKQAQGMRPGPQLTALQRDVESVKLETRLCFLETLARFARARGYEALANDATRAARQLREAPAASGPGIDMPMEKATPGKEVRP
jgi:hypothetical protein